MASSGGRIVDLAAASRRSLYSRMRPRRSWRRQGDFITFEWQGFVSAPSIPGLFARHHYECETIRRVFGDRPIARSLEVGCGFGRLSPTFASLSNDHVGLDINAEALGTARTAYPGIAFAEGTVTSIPYEDDTFDLVATWTVLQHVPPTLIDRALAEILRVLTPEGRVLLCEETRTPGAPTEHSWHREPGFYESRLGPLRMTYSDYIDAIDEIPGLDSPGRVMLFETTSDKP